MANRPFEWMVLRRSEGLSYDDRQEYRLDLELADVVGIGLRKDWITIHMTTDEPLPIDQREAELEVLIRARDALETQIAAIQQSP
jgi:hypothetical protein